MNVKSLVLIHTFQLSPSHTIVQQELQIGNTLDNNRIAFWTSRFYRLVNNFEILQKIYLWIIMEEDKFQFHKPLSILFLHFCRYHAFQIMLPLHVMGQSLRPILWLNEDIFHGPKQRVNQSKIRQKWSKGPETLLFLS